MTHHYRHFFHPAGHGTFFSGRIQSDNGSFPDFVWIYDCGSRRRSHLRALAEQFRRGLSPPRIDLMCLSHFDSDHVSGLDVFFQAGFHVDTLVLPYAPPAARLLLAGTLMEEDAADSHQVAALLLDPIHYLRRHDQLGRIGRIVLVRGAMPDDPDSREGVPFPVDPPWPSRNADSRVHIPNLESLSDEAAYGVTAIDGLTCMAHPQQAWTFDARYEFVFYNIPLRGDLAPRSGTGLKVVAQEIRQLVDTYDLTRPGAAKPGWLAAIRALYDRHFGHTAHQRNAISLCVQARSIQGHAYASCDHFKEAPGVCELPVLDGDQIGVLLTGDISLNRKTLLALRQHLGYRRWQSLALMQIPHHGSRDSWQAGNSAECQHPHNVICAPGTPLHPHSDVTMDLGSHVLADYAQAVAFSYHDR